MFKFIYKRSPSSTSCFRRSFSSREWNLCDRQTSECEDRKQTRVWNVSAFMWTWRGSVCWNRSEATWRDTRAALSSRFLIVMRQRYSLCRALAPPLAPEDYGESDRPVNHWSWRLLSLWSSVTPTSPLLFLHTHTHTHTHTHSRNPRSHVTPL